MKSKKVITLSLSDLKDLGVLPRKNKKKNKKRKRRVKVVLVDPNTGAIIGGAKSDSSHMQGSIQSFQAPQFTNTANISSAIQEENLKAIERANKQAKDELKPTEQNQLLLGYLDDRFSKVVEHNNNLFGSIVPNLQRIENDNQQQKIINQQQKNINQQQKNINQQGFNMIQNLAGGNSYYNTTDNVGFNNNSISSDTLPDQGNAKPIETTRFQTPVPKASYASFNAKINENDYNNTPQGIPQSLLKEKDSVNKLGNQYDNLIGSKGQKQQEEPDEKPKLKKEQSPYTKHLIDKLKTKGRGNKLTKEQVLHMYKGAGGNDPEILNSKYVKTIESAYNKLIKNK